MAKTNIDTTHTVKGIRGIGNQVVVDQAKFDAIEAEKENYRDFNQTVFNITA